MRLEDLDLTRELPGEPDIIGIEQGEVLASSVVQPEIPRRAHPMVAMPRVLQVAHAVRLALGPAAGERTAAVGGAVVDQQQLPVRVGLRDHALDGLIQKALSIQEDRDDRYQRSSAHESLRPEILGVRHRVLRREVGTRRKRLARCRKHTIERVVPSVAGSRPGVGRPQGMLLDVKRLADHARPGRQELTRMPTTFAARPRHTLVHRRDRAIPRDPAATGYRARGTSGRSNTA